MSERYSMTIVALMIGFSMAVLVSLSVGENPIHVLGVLLTGAFGSLTDFGYTLFYATPLMLTGLGFAWAMRAGLFNIGSEGQMCMGGLAMIATALSMNTYSPWLAIPVSLLASFFAGGTWGAIAGWLRAYRGTHEVLSTILLNFIAYGVVAYFVLNVLKNPASQAPETFSLPSTFSLPNFGNLGGNSPVNLGLVIALVIAALWSFISHDTKFGFYQRMTGGAPKVGQFAGANMRLHMVGAFFIAGGLAGMAGLSDLLGYSLKLREGFSNGAGFVGIAVALLGRQSSMGIVFSSLLFGALQKGSLGLELDTNKITRDLALVIQAAIIVSVVSEKGFRDFLDWIRRKKSG